MVNPVSRDAKVLYCQCQPVEQEFIKKKIRGEMLRYMSLI